MNRHEECWFSQAYRTAPQSNVNAMRMYSSPNGAQVQSERPLRPGSRVHVRVAARTWTLAVSADVVRCSVWLLQADSVIYRGALRFEEACAGVWDQGAGTQLPGEAPL